MSRKFSPHGVSRCCLQLVLPALVLVSLTAQAIIVRHDRRDSSYQALAERFPQVFWLHEEAGHKRCLATLVDAEWALTAAHCLQETPLQDTLQQGASWPVSLDHEANAIDGVVIHPRFDPTTSKSALGVDLALLHLAHGVGLAPMRLYDGQEENGRTLTIMGWGYTGNGKNGRKGNDGRFRLATNEVSAAGQWLEIVFDDPRRPGSHVPDLEGMPGMGDSGGPALLGTEQGFLLAGVARGELAREETSTQGLYGSVAVYERISHHAAWISDVIRQGGAGSP